MIQSVESRVFSAGAWIPDLHVSTTRLPAGLRTQEFLAQHLSEEGFVIPLQDMADAIRRIPGEGPWTHIQRPAELKFQLIPMLAPPAPSITQAFQQKYGPDFILNLREARQNDLSLQRIEQIANRALVFAAALTNFELAFVHLLLEELAHYQVPVAQSPELGAISLSKLLEGGARSACLVPLMTGLHGAVQQQLAGSFALAFESTAVGAGITLVALSTLWLADRILKGLHSHELLSVAEQKQDAVRTKEDFVQQQTRKHPAPPPRRQRSTIYYYEDTDSSSSSERDSEHRGELPREKHRE
jgi:hypothetical protein